MGSNHFNRNTWKLVNAIGKEEHEKELLNRLSNKYKEPEIFGYKIKIDKQETEGETNFLTPVEMFISEVRFGSIPNPKLLVWLANVLDEHIERDGELKLEDLLGLNKASTNQMYSSVLYSNFTLAVLLIRDCKFFHIPSDAKQESIAEYFYSCGGNLDELIEHTLSDEESISMCYGKYQKYLRTYSDNGINIPFNEDFMPTQESFLRGWRRWKNRTDNLSNLKSVTS